MRPQKEPNYRQEREGREGKGHDTILRHLSQPKTVQTRNMLCKTQDSHLNTQEILLLRVCISNRGMASLLKLYSTQYIRFFLLPDMLQYLYMSRLWMIEFIVPKIEIPSPPYNSNFLMTMLANSYLDLLKTSKQLGQLGELPALKLGQMSYLAICNGRICSKR